MVRGAKPCRNGHAAVRDGYGACIECAKVNRAKWRAKNRPRELAVTAIWRERNRARHREMINAWNAKYPWKKPAQTRARQARKRNATPKWLTREQHREMEQFYKTAREQSAPHHVDHVIPIDGRKVCGLHVPCNLQVLSGPDNLSKGNRF